MAHSTCKAQTVREVWFATPVLQYVVIVSYQKVFSDIQIS